MGEIEIIWSPEARARFEEIYNYLWEKWSLRVANNFKEETLSQVDLLALYPYMGIPIEYRLDLYKRLLTSHNYLYYLIHDGRIIIIDIIDTRQEPATSDKEDE